jgi:hypothetical protein
MATCIQVISDVKYQTMNMGLHAYDIFFYPNRQTLAFLWSDYRSYLVVAGGAATFAAVLAVLIWRFDRTRYPRIASGVALAATVAVAAWLAAPAYAQRRAFQIYVPPGDWLTTLSSL